MKKQIFLCSIFFCCFQFCLSQPGRPDSSFGKNGIVIADFYLTNIAIGPDKKIVVGGYIDEYQGRRFTVRYNTDGSIDHTFLVDSNSTHFEYGQGHSIAIQDDGKVVVGGGDSSLVRYNLDGSLDKTFNEDGILNNDFGIAKVAIQKDGKIVVAGGVYRIQGEAPLFGLARYTPEGSPDSSFSDDGKQITDPSYDSEESSSLGSYYSLAIQSDGKIVMAGADRYNYPISRGGWIARYNIDGSVDKIKPIRICCGTSYATSIVIGPNNEIVITGETRNRGQEEIETYPSFLKLDPVDWSEKWSRRDISESTEVTAIGNNGKILLSSGERFNTDGSSDTSFKLGRGANAAAILDNNLYVVVGNELSRHLWEDSTPSVSFTSPINNAIYTAPATITIKAAATGYSTEDTITKVEFYNSTTLLHTETEAPYTYTWKDVGMGNYTLTAKATDNSGVVTTSAEVKISVVAPNIAPTVNITNPADHQTIAGPSTIRLRAAAKDPDGKITKVEFYNGTALLRTEIAAPYTYRWINVPVGNYAITAIATDNNGASTSSAAVNISVVPNKAPTVSIINPANNESFTAPATIPLIASAKDPDGTISRVEFYNGATLLNTQYESPYTHTMRDVPAGTYTITAKAIDNLGLATISAPVTVTVTSQNTIVSSKPAFGNKQADIKDAISLHLYPNPTRNIINIYTKGLQQNKQTTLSVISASGAVMKMMQSNRSTQTIQMNVSSLVRGVYIIKVISGDKVVYRQFVKL